MSVSPRRDSLPEWPRECIGEIASFAGGVAFPRAEQGQVSGEFPFLKVSDMNAPGNERELFSSANWITEEQRSRLRARLWPAGTVVFPKVGAALKTEKRRILTRPSAFDNNVMGLVPKERILPRYLLAVMETIRFGDFAQEGVVPSINQRMVASIQVPIPPLGEQARMVELLDAFDANTDALQRQRMQLRHLKVALLKEAYIDTTEGEHVAIGDLLESTVGGVWGAEPGEEACNVEIVRSTNFDNDGTLHLAAAAARSISEKQLTNRALRAGDILLEKSGGGPHQPVGRVVRVTADLPEHTCSNFVQLVRPDADKVAPEWLFYHLWADHACGLTLQYQAVAVGIRNLRTKDYLARQVVLPSRTEQERIGRLADAIDIERKALDAQAVHLARLCSSTVTALLGGSHELPEIAAELLAMHDRIAV